MNTSELGAYTKPHLKRIGSFEEITQATTTGGVLDAAYPQNTPVFGHTYDPGTTPTGPGGFS